VIYLIFGLNWRTNIIVRKCNEKLVDLLHWLLTPGKFSWAGHLCLPHASGAFVGAAVVGGAAVGGAAVGGGGVVGGGGAAVGGGGVVGGAAVCGGGVVGGAPVGGGGVVGRPKISSTLLANIFSAFEVKQLL